MYNDLPESVVAVMESHVLVADAIAALDGLQGDELRRFTEALQVVYNNQVAFLDTWAVKCPA